MKVFKIVLPALIILFATSAFAKKKGSVEIRNCTDERVFVCVYNGHDKVMSIAAEAHGVRPGKKHTFNCATNRCKTFVAISMKKAKNLMKEAGVAGAAGAIVGGTAAGVAGASSIAGGTAMLAAFAAPGAAVGTAATTGAVGGGRGRGNRNRCHRWRGRVWCSQAD